MFIGVDGCKGGWIAVSLTAGGEMRQTVYPSISMLWSTVKEDHPHILIDMPIGLPEASERATDAQARRILGARRSSIFSVPVRNAVYAQTYAEACEINLQSVGKKFPLQFWHIAPKVREVDTLLRTDTAAIHRIYESHPEVVFCGLNHGQPLRHNKKTPAGWQERLSILQRTAPSLIAPLYTMIEDTSRQQAMRDDVVDAYGLAVAAWLMATAAEHYPRHTLPASPQVDAHGLPMQIVYTLNTLLP